MRNLASQISPGTSVKFEIWRAGAERELTARLAEREIAGNNTSKQLKSEPIVHHRSESSQAFASKISRRNGPKKLKLQPSARGVVITEVHPDSNAAAAGLRLGSM